MAYEIIQGLLVENLLTLELKNNQFDQAYSQGGQNYPHMNQMTNVST